MANIHDIAREVDLSITTVSRVLNGKADYYRIGKKTQKRVREAAERMHYIPNEYAANLRTGKSNTIALSVPSIANPFFGEIASVLDKELGSMGFLTILTESGEDVSIAPASWGRCSLYRSYRCELTYNRKGLIMDLTDEQRKAFYEVYQIILEGALTGENEDDTEDEEAPQPALIGEAQ